MKLSDAPRRKVQHVMLFGDPKTGKSTLAAELASAGYKLIWISLDGGHEILWKLSEEAKENIELLEIPDTKEMPIGIITCLQLISGAAVSICDIHGIRDCASCRRGHLSFTSVNLSAIGSDTIVVFDHVSQLASSAVAHITKQKVDAANRAKPGSQTAEDYKLDYDDWRTQGNYLGKFFTNVQQARYNIICIAHVQEAENEEGKKKLVPDVGTRNFSVGVGKYFDHIVYCTLNNMKHRFGSATTFMNSISTGSRSDVALEKMEVASLLSIFEGLLDTQRTDARENMNGGHLVESTGDAGVVAIDKPVIHRLDNGGQFVDQEAIRAQAQTAAGPQQQVTTADITAMENNIGISQTEKPPLSLLEQAKARLAASRGLK